MLNLSTMYLLRQKPPKLIKFFTILAFILFATQEIFAQRTITGTVSNASTAEKLGGVSVAVKGTNQGAFTDANGNYSVNISNDQAVLIFSYIGFLSQEVSVTGKTVINLELVEQDLQSDEVVITALGISREKKTLTYSAQNINTETLSQARDLNLANSLSGKIAGVVVSRSSSGLGGSARVILRGNRSITGNNQPLYVIDGIPIDNSGGSPSSAFGGRDAGDGISNINPDDIETMTVLKGASATALYGARANNGAIVITTKKGASRQGIGVSLNSSFQTERLIELIEFQNEFGQGNGGVYNPRGEQNWGPALDGKSVPNWSPDPKNAGTTIPFDKNPDNYKDFYGTGYNWANTLALNAGNDRTQAYFSYTWTDAQGIVETNKLQRHNANLRVTSKFGEKLVFDSKINFISQDVDNRQFTGEAFQNTQRHILRIPRNISLDMAKVFEYTDANGNNRQHYWNPGSNGGENPFWTLNRIITVDERTRMIGFGSLTYSITDELKLMVRSGIDRYWDNNDQRYFNDTYTIADNGQYTVVYRDVLELNNDFLLSYNKTLNENFTLSLNFGGSNRHNTVVDHSSSNNGLLKPNLFSLSNARNPSSSRADQERELNSLYGFAQFGYKDFLFLDVTGRNDWSSTLPRDNWSFFYPSVGLTWIVSDMLELPAAISFAKVRASYAEVGNDAPLYLVNQTYTFSQGGPNGYLIRDGVKPFPDLQPELTKSVEIGADLRFLENRIGIDFTWYKTNSTNQLLTVPLPVASGWSSEFINAGDIQNSGIELTINLTPVKTDDFEWDLSFNYAKNVSEVIELTDEIKSFNLVTDFMNVVRVDEGGTFGELFSRGFERDGQGRVIVASNGLPKITGGQTVNLGNFNPDWTGGILNNLSYKNLSLSFLVDIRQGGVITSFTNANIYADGVVEKTLLGRSGTTSGIVDLDPKGRLKADIRGNQGLVVQGVKEDGTPNDIVITPEVLWRNIGGRNTPVGEAFTSDASYVRMRELTLGYRLPTVLLKNTFIRGVNVSFVGRNLFFFSNEADGFDPDIVVGAENASQGLESFALPSTRTYGFNLGLTF